ncbi:MAG: phosphotransferase [Kribbellaceae bacterium]|nr:phosphotransferase [Kribbellaceae bacterium]
MLAVLASFGLAGYVRSYVAEAIELLSRGRSMELVRTFEHGAGGTSLARLDGEPVVVKAWLTTREREQTLNTGLNCANIMADRSVPIPRLLERGIVGNYSYLLYEYVEGEWPARVDPNLADQMLALTELQRDAAPRSDPDSPAHVARMISDGDPSLDIHPERLRTHAQGQAILRATQAALDTCDPRHLRSKDVVHGDFAPENLLVNGGQISAVIDWEQSRTGDVAFDLAGMIYDIELGKKASPQVLASLYRAINSRVPPDAWQLYTGIYAIRYASWALTTDMETDVLNTINAVNAARYMTGCVRPGCT